MLRETASSIFQWIGLLKPPKAERQELADREGDGNAEDAAEISRYLVLADAALRPERRFRLERQNRNATDTHA